ncbi:MAG: efflux RND transporter periplasmic adaptor subunit [Acidobacteria bacterium ACB2]|nr:efflux RND transporter periplasmic adaptor subunit [Acidobacteria bacterium ACB2]
MSKTGWIVGAVVLASVAGTGIYLAKGKKEGPKFRKEKVDRGDVTATVTASGTLSAVTTVKVGSQVSGIISRLHADFNSPVRRGQLLAELDQTPFQASVDQRRADLERSKVELRNAELSYARAKSLSEQQLMSQAEFDAAKASRDSAAAAVAQSAAALRQAETNLAYTSIVSPIDGVVVDRQYDVGQTVAASFQAPTLFTIAQDLTKMQVATNIDEADIGRVKTGQKASFTVDAFPDRKFEGVVSQIRLSPQTVQNVVTYPVIVEAPNEDLKLLPGMTASLSFRIDEREKAIKIPNAALRFYPKREQVRPEDRPLLDGVQDREQQQEEGVGENEPSAAEKTLAAKKRKQRHVWVVEGRLLKAIPVTTGLSDNQFTELVTGDLQVGQELVTGVQVQQPGA